MLALPSRSTDGSAAAVTLAALALVGVGIAAWERGPGGAREVALVGSFGAAAAAGRVLFAAIPNVQPVTTMTACAGVALGPRAGAAVGGLAALVSNGFLGQGPWTPWQMLAWGLVGATGGAAGPLLRRSRHRADRVLRGLGLRVRRDPQRRRPRDVRAEPGRGRRSGRSRGAGLPFDVAHATGNAVLAAVAGPSLIRLLDRYGRRLRVELEPELVSDADGEPVAAP